MKITPTSLQNLQGSSLLIQYLAPFCSQVQDALNNGLSFQDNFASSAVVVKFPSSAAQNIQIAHNLPITPSGYLIARSSTFCSICDGVSLVLGPKFANLKCNVAGVTATIIFF